MLSKEGVGDSLQGGGTERHVVCKGERVNFYGVLVRKYLWCLRGELVNVY